MRKVIAAEWMSLDGVVQAPAYPDEDVSGGFKHGGPGHHGPGRMHGLDAAAKYLGMTEAALRNALEGGKTLAQVAKDRKSVV